MSRSRHLFLCPFLVLISSSCAWDGYPHAATMGDSRTRVHVLYDSPVVQSAADQLLQAKQQHVRAFSSHNEKEGMAAFLASQELYRKLADELGREPGYDVPGQTQFRILVESDILPYSKVEFDEGPIRGGWVGCIELRSTTLGITCHRRIAIITPWIRLVQVRT